MNCTSLVLGLHLLTWHAEPGFNGNNPGIQIKCDQIAIGTYKNSFYKQSFYIGYHWTEVIGPIDVTFLMVTGYPSHKIIPVPVPSFKIGVIRIGFMPSVTTGLTATHLMIEKEF